MLICVQLIWCICDFFSLSPFFSEGGGGGKWKLKQENIMFVKDSKTVARHNLKCPTWPWHILRSMLSYWDVSNLWIKQQFEFEECTTACSEGKFQLLKAGNYGKEQCHIFFISNSLACLTIQGKIKCVYTSLYWPYVQPLMTYFSPMRTTRSGLEVILKFSHKSSNVTIFCMNLSSVISLVSDRPPHSDNEKLPRFFTSECRKLTGGPPMAPSTEWGDTGRDAPRPDSSSSSFSNLSCMETNLWEWNLK